MSRPAWPRYWGRPDATPMVVQVDEVRYDLEDATGLALHGRGFPANYDGSVYTGLSDGESVALTQARCALIEAGRRLGRGW